MKNNFLDILDDENALPESVHAAFYNFFEKYKKFEEKGKIYIFNVLEREISPVDFLGKWNFFAGGVIRSNMEYININADKISVNLKEIKFESKSKNYLHLYTFKQLLVLTKSYTEIELYSEKLKNSLLSNIEGPNYINITLLDILINIVTLRNMLAHDVNPNLSNIKLEFPRILDSNLESINIDVNDFKELYTKLTIACFWIDYISYAYFDKALKESIKA